MGICEKLKEARKNAGMTQEQVAEKIMVSRVTISHWENGKSLPDISGLISLSDLYNSWHGFCNKLNCHVLGI